MSTRGIRNIPGSASINELKTGTNGAKLTNRMTLPSLTPRLAANGATVLPCGNAKLQTANLRPITAHL